MTSIYGKDPAFHRDAAEKFFDDNPEIFKGIELHPVPSQNRK